MAKEFDMLRIMWRHFTKKSKYMFTNIFFFYEGISVEADFMIIDDDGYCNEYEIKCDKKDFVEEFKSKPDKHNLLRDRHYSCPNRYYFAALPGIIDKETIPEYAGFVEFEPTTGGDYRMRTIKKAPLLHKIILDPKNLFQKIYYTYFNCKQTLYSNDRKRIRRADGSKAEKQPTTKSTVTKKGRRSKGLFGR